MAVTLRDVAERAGVSPRTVSNVVNDFPLVAHDTRKRVQRVVDELGYRPNLVARNLRRGSSGLIALALPELRVPYFSELAGLIVKEAAQHGYTVVIEQTDGDRETERRLLLGNERGHLFDAVIFSPLALGAAEIRALSGRLPIVFLGEHAGFPGGDGPYDHVGIDNVAAARDATAHLVSLGRTRIAAIGHQRATGHETGQLRTEGYREALREGGLRFRKELLVPARSFDRESGATAMSELLELPRPPDAVFCYNDLLAVGALRVALTRGVRVPDDLAVVGFDDIEEARYTVPALSTLAPDRSAIAREATTRLLARLKDRSLPPCSVVVGHSLVVRESTRAG